MQISAKQTQEVNIVCTAIKDTVHQISMKLHAGRRLDIDIDISTGHLNIKSVLKCIGQFWVFSVVCSCLSHILFPTYCEEYTIKDPPQGPA